MVRKKMEGDEAQRRRAAHEAHRSGTTPSEEGSTTGASKQRRHLPGSDSISHEERLESIRRGKQGSEPERREPARGPDTAGDGRSFTDRETGPYAQEHERVFRALTEAQREHGGEPVHLDEVARTAGLSREETVGPLHDLVTVHRLATELAGSDSPDLGPRFQVKPRL